ncbi:zinc finger protein 62-like [Haliotis cracherodii]|uniref:zinc finger protein 62-like n=1 Tax=Haliotis cracherodii TaxID=6455 RepID=UPI0039EBCBFD
METLRDADHESTLRQRFEDLRNHQALCDVTLVSNDGHKFEAHYLYLAVNSAYFHQELSFFRKGSMLPSNVFIKIDVPSSILGVLLDYVYTGELAVTKETIQEIENISVKLKFEDAQSLLSKSKYYSSVRKSCSEEIRVLPKNLLKGVCTPSMDTAWDAKDSNEQDDQESNTTDEEVLQDAYQDLDAGPGSGKKRKSSPVKSTPTKNVFKTERCFELIEDIPPETMSGRKKRTSRSAKDKSVAVAELPKRKSARGSNAGGSSLFNSDVSKGSGARRSVRNLSKVEQKSSTSGQAGSSKRTRPVQQKIAIEPGKRQSSRLQQTSWGRLSYASTPEVSDDELEGEEGNYDFIDDDETLPEQTTDSFNEHASLEDFSECEGQDAIVKKDSYKQAFSCADHKAMELPSKKSRTKSKSKDSKNVSLKSKRPNRTKHPPKRFDPSDSSPKRRKNKVSSKQLELSFQPLSKNISLRYLTSRCTRWAFEASSSMCHHDYDKKTWQCCRCPESFSMYSRWRLHYRSVHLAFMLLRLKKIRNMSILKLKRPPKKRNRLSRGSVVMMNSGKVRKMPGPKCTLSRAAMVKCIECGVMLASRASLKNHLLQYHNLTRQQVERHKSLLVCCEVTGCAFANIDIQKVERHVRESHPEVRHPCPECQRSFVRQDLLNQHVLRIHQNQTKFMCSRCGERFKKSCDQKIHEQQVHGVDHNFVVYSCNVEGCDYQTITARYLDAHKKAKHFDNRIQCSYCPTKVKTKLALQMHVNALHLNKRPYLCEICGSGFCDPWTLQRHIAFRHSTTREYSCDHCQYACNNRIQFMNHTFQQHGVKAEFDKRQEQTCPVCSYRALSASRMKAHIRHIHADPHKYTCEICGKGFKNRHYLRDHQVIHSDSTYQCPHCDYSPWTSGKLKKHIRTQHIFKDVKPYSCPYCSYACALSGNCRKHVVHKHPGFDVKYNTDKDMLAYMRKVESELHTGKIKATTAKKA